MQNTGTTSTMWPTSMSYGPNFAGDNLEIAGVAMYFEYRSASPNGWGKVVLRNTTDNLDAAGPITFDVQDLPAAPISGDGGFWAFFKFAASATLTTGKNFAIGIQAQNGTQIYGYKTATANDFNRLLRRTATAAPQASDSIWIVGEITGQGTGNDITITYDNNVADAYGAAVDWKSGHFGRGEHRHHSACDGRTFHRHGGGQVPAGHRGEPHRIGLYPYPAI